MTTLILYNDISNTASGAYKTRYLDNKIGQNGKTYIHKISSATIKSYGKYGSSLDKIVNSTPSANGGIEDMLNKYGISIYNEHSDTYGNYTAIDFADGSSQSYRDWYVVFYIEIAYWELKSDGTLGDRAYGTTTSSWNVTLPEIGAEGFTPLNSSKVPVSFTSDSYFSLARQSSSMTSKGSYWEHFKGNSANDYGNIGLAPRGGSNQMKVYDWVDSLKIESGKTNYLKINLAVAESKKYTVTYSISEFLTSSNTATKVEEGSKYTTTFTVTNDKYYTDETLITCTDDTAKIVKNSNGTVTLTIDNVTKDFTITGNVQEKPTYYNATYNITNATHNGKDQYVKGSNVEIEILANSGYTLTDKDVKVDYRNTESSYPYMTPYEDNSGVIVQIDNLQHDFTITANAKIIPKVYHTLTQTLSNCTSNVSDTQIEDGKSLTVTLTPSDGYTLKTDGVTCSDSSAAITKSGNNVQVTISSVKADVTITANAVETTTQTFNVSTNLTNCTADKSTVQVAYGDSVIITLQPNDGYSFKYYKSTGTAYKLTDVKASISGSATLTQDFDYIPNTALYGIKCTISNVQSDIELSAIAQKGTFQTTITYSGEHLTANCPSGTKVWDYGYVSFTIDEGYQVNSGDLTIIQHSSDLGDIDVTDDPKYRPQMSYPLDMYWSNIEAHRDSASDGIYTGYDFNFTVTKKPSVGLDFIHAYKADDSDLKQLMQARFVTLAPSDNIGRDNDLGNFIMHLFKFPYHLDLETVDAHIVLSNKDTDITSKSILNEYAVVDLGEITVPNKRENATDFINVDCELYLPFRDKLRLDEKYVIGQTISAKYIINIYTGVGTLIISSTFTNGIIYSDTVQCFSEYPVTNAANQYVANGFNTVYNEIKQPYIEVSRKIPIDDGMFNKKSLIHGTLADKYGWLEVNRIILKDFNGTDTEQAQIIQLLRNGVYHNESKE